jgi:hypothetical protein
VNREWNGIWNASAVQENRQLDRFDTLDRRVASKIVYTHRF